MLRVIAAVALLAFTIYTVIDCVQTEDDKVKGLPTVVIYDSKGQERKRFTEFVKPEPFLSALEGIE